MIKCDLQDIPKYALGAGASSEHTKKGRYHGSMFWDVPGYGTKRWVVAARIRPNQEVGGLMEEEIIDGCLAFLNTPPPRRKYQKKKPKPKYGNLKLYSATLKKDSAGVIISALLIVEDRKSKHFWGSGIIGK